MAHSGRFKARALGSEWRGMELLAAMCEHAQLTKREAHSFLLYCRGIGFAWQAALLHLGSRQAAWDNWKRAVEKMTATFDPLIRRQEIAAEQETKENWERILLRCFRNARKRPDHAPQAVRDFWGRWWEGGRDPLLSAADLGEEDPERRFLLWVEAWLQEAEGQERRVGVRDDRPAAA